MATTINPADYERCHYPGKFEGENPATEYFYDESLRGNSGETVCVGHVDEYGEEFEQFAEVFCIDAEESEAFDLPIGHWYLIREDSQGFVIGTCHETRDAAEQACREWCGID